MRPPFELGFFELEIGPPADTVHVLAEGSLFAANSAQMALVHGVALEQRFDPSR